MERHRIMDFGLDPESHELWVTLDACPSDVWLARLSEPVDRSDDVSIRPGAGSRLPVPTAIGAHVGINAGAVDELDALTLLSAHVWAANAAMATVPARLPDRKRFRRP